MLAPLLGAALAVLFVSPASAQEPRRPGEPRIMAEPSELLQVVDAVDDDDPFDFHLTVGFQQTWNNAKIRRETTIDQLGDSSDPALVSGGFTSDGMNVAEYTQTISRLNLRADVGLYRDVGLYFRLPVILSNSQKLGSLDGSQTSQSLVLQGAPGEQLFTLPFKSPDRSGIEYLAVGLDFALMNQFRDKSLPTWVLGVEGRFNVSEPMRACNANPASGQVSCADPRDGNRNGTSDGEPVNVPGTAAGTDNREIKTEGDTAFGAKQPGVSRGTHAFEIHSYIGKRMYYVEPYFGLKALFEFGTSSSNFGQVDVPNAIAPLPPIQGTLLAGVAVIPWEVKERFQRLSFDFRFTGNYRSEGRDYSPLFDALGSSDARNLRLPQWSGYRANPDTTSQFPSVVDPSSRQVFFTGLTNISAHGIYTWSASTTMQAGEYVKFGVGGAFTYVQSHLISQDRACSTTNERSATLAGPCAPENAITATSMPNANYRDVIDAPGRRFKVDDAYGFDAWVNATVMF